MEDMAGALPGLTCAPTFLDHFKQAHPSPMSAWGDVVDNCRDAKATRLDIDVRSVDAAAAGGGHVVVVTDDGCGMLEDDMAKGIRGLGYTDKGLETGQHYGFGATTGLPRLFDSCFVFSSRRGEDGTLQRTVCFLSTKLQSELAASQVVTPQCTWDAAGVMLQSDTALLSAAKRRTSLETIMSFSPFTSEAALLAEFDQGCGTRLVLWGSLEEEHELTRDDIRVREARRQEDACRWEHEYSLRAYLEILYYCDDRVRPTMRIFIGGVEVTPRNWSTALKHRTEAKPYYPQVDPASNGGEKAVAWLDLGYAEELQEVVRVLKERQGGQAELAARKREVNDYSGVFYYHRLRVGVRVRCSA